MKPILRVEQLNKRFGSLSAVKEVSFEVYPGEIVGLLGHNGAGKSTLIRCLMGVIRSYKGRVYIDGKNIRRFHYAVRDNAGFLLEPSFCDHLSARANLEMLNAISHEPDRQRVEEVLELVSLKNAANKKVGEFSFGMRERLGLACALLTQPQLLVLDEPTVGLDPLGVEIIKKVMVDCAEHGVAVLFSSHQIHDVLDICHRAIVMNSGAVVYDGPAAELTRKQYAVHVNADVAEHAEALRQILPDLQVEGTVLRFDAEQDVNAILTYLVQHNLPVAAVECDSDRNALNTLMAR